MSNPARVRAAGGVIVGRITDVRLANTRLKETAMAAPAKSSVHRAARRGHDISRDKECRC